MYDICMKGFVDGYYNWTIHGEAQVLENYDDQPAPVCLETSVAPGMRMQSGGTSSYEYDVSGLSERFFDVVQGPDQPLYSGCDQSQLATVARLVNIKAEHKMSERCYDQVSQWASDLLPRDHTLPSNYYSTKKMIRDLGLPVKKIHA
ncbi:UNVERIFIED_CONTAM: hypothetical protein Scaly_2203300 [Sesamum calycinum]|uniref:Uncharacterized protein n=1 Tax=Sesamum calycinum TaxID=2727403 RepID=A0AAW2MQ07_9LAMI